ncbi:anthrax toxin receptor-like isoform X1 [Talpa occidentalis]|uniref:anthrax toxin receptor-like isoform X1 n=1 Tax=Talpa occidentalis TaxID=50954 RepID=UPI00188F2A18|nr:anthrax toxin receptor-like isoform X1 [Talpa occidentalis]
MGGSCLRVPGLAFLLLLVLPPLLPSSGAYQHRAPTWLDFHHLTRARRSLPSNTNLDGESTRQGHSQDMGSRERLADHKKSCQSNLDLYLILDKSGSVDTNWIVIYGFVEDFLKMFQNPNMRVSIVTFSTRGHTVLKLTSDKKEIEDGLNKLRNTEPTGATNMQEGFKAVNEQISTVNSGEKKVHSMVVSLIDGALWPESFQATKNEAQRTRQLGGTVYVVGVNNYVKNQLLAIADSEEHVVGVDSGFYDLRNIVDSLAAKACIELTSVGPTDYCVGENYDVGVFGRGFHNTNNKKEVLCRIQISDTIFFDKKATQVEDTSIKCPGVMMEVPANEISVEVSLNNGASFISNGLKISSKDCGGHRTSQRTDISPSGVPPTHSSSVIRPMRKVLRRNAGLAQVPQPPDLSNAAAAGPGNQGIQFPNINPYHLAACMLVLILMIGCLWLHRRKNKMVEPCLQTCPTVVVPCGDDKLRQLKDKLDTLHMQIVRNILQNRNRSPVICHSPGASHVPYSGLEVGGCAGTHAAACNTAWRAVPSTTDGCVAHMPRADLPHSYVPGLPGPYAPSPHNRSAPGSPPGCCQ